MESDPEYRKGALENMDLSCEEAMELKHKTFIAYQELASKLAMKHYSENLKLKMSVCSKADAKKVSPTILTIENLTKNYSTYFG